MQLGRHDHPFDRLVQHGDGEIRVAEAALLFAADHYRHLDVVYWLRRLDDWGRRVGDVGAATPAEQIDALHTVLVDQERLTGNHDDYYDPRNSMLNEVLTRKRGIPISLAVVWLDICRQLSWSFEGVGFPGHFLIRQVRPDGDRLVDPFYEGRIVTVEHCASMAARLYGRAVELTAADFRVCSDKAILIRMLKNLRAIFLKRQQWYAGTCVLERLLALCPDAQDVREQLGTARAGLAALN